MVIECEAAEATILGYWPSKFKKSLMKYLARHISEPVVLILNQWSTLKKGIWSKPCSSSRNVHVVRLKDTTFKREECIAKSLINRLWDAQELSIVFFSHSECPVLKQILSSFRLTSWRVTAREHLQGMHSVLASLSSILSFSSCTNKTLSWELKAAVSSLGSQRCIVLN